MGGDRSTANTSSVHAAHRRGTRRKEHFEKLVWRSRAWGEIVDMSTFNYLTFSYRKCIVDDMLSVMNKCFPSRIERYMMSDV